MLQTASFMGILRTILIILLIYYGFKLLARLAAPYFVGYMSKKMQDRYKYQTQRNSDSYKQEKVGETVIDKVPKNQNKSNEDVGEYIDYEEVEE
ncbi:MAG: DUF4834 family protein [Flavobacteriaceae bacterium]|nr:DUF4834 family protein [Flavobacteriaceae bacterium]